MPLDPQFRTILDTLESSGLLPLIRGDAAQTRAHYRTLSLSRRGPGFVPEQVASVTDLRSPGGVPVRIFEPLSPGGFTLVYLHGGGWVVGDVETHDPLCRRVANRIGARVVLGRLPARARAPVPGRPGRHRGGAALAAGSGPGPAGRRGRRLGRGVPGRRGLAIRARDQRIPLAAQLLLYPATDPAMTSASITENGEGYFLTRRDMAWSSTGSTCRTAWPAPPRPT